MMVPKLTLFSCTRVGVDIARSLLLFTSKVPIVIIANEGMNLSSQICFDKCVVKHLSTHKEHAVKVCLF